MKTWSFGLRKPVSNIWSSLKGHHFFFRGMNDNWFLTDDAIVLSRLFAEHKLQTYMRSYQVKSSI
jgi:hypothetical protein